MSTPIIHTRFKSSCNPNKVERNFYKVWSEMNRRCRQATSIRNNKSYFKKSITVSDRWKNFDYFFIDMWDSYLFHRELNKGDTELDRINNDKGYSKINCKWSTRLENMNNIGKIRKIRGKTFTEWSNLLGIDRETLLRRYYVSKWSIDRVLGTKVGTWRKRKTIITS